MITPDPLEEEFPLKISLVQFEDGAWGWDTGKKGSFGFDSPEEALAHFRKANEVS